MKNELPNKIRPESQTEIDQTIINFLGDFKVVASQDLIVLKDMVLTFLEWRPYTNETKEHADSIQWKRKASEILQDKYIYRGKACSDLAVIFLTLCKAVGIDGRLVKLRSMDGNNTHSIVEVKLNDTWYSIDPSSKDSVPVDGRLNDESVWNKKYKVWKKGRDVWDLCLDDKNKERDVCNHD